MARPNAIEQMTMEELESLRARIEAVIAKKLKEQHPRGGVVGGPVILKQAP